MYCHNCGREIPDDARFCTFCGAPAAEPAPRHAKPGPVEEDIYSYSDQNIPRDLDEQAFISSRDPLDETRVYAPGTFDNIDDGYYPEQSAPYIDDPMSNIDPYDSYEMYQDGEDDETFMDKLDNRFRRYDDDEEEDEREKKNLTWLWVTIIVFLLVLLIVLGILLYTGALSKDKDGDNAASSVPATSAMATVPATVKPTEAETEPETEKPTEAETEAPETQAPATEPPVVITEAPDDPQEPETTDPNEGDPVMSGYDESGETEGLEE